MARSTQNIDKPFSRIKNGLAELQPMWPAYVKGDGGLTVDPQIFRSNFGPTTPSLSGLVDDVANTPGIRVEAINDNGTDAGTETDPAGIEPTLTISGSGGFKPICTLTHADSTKTSVFLIAPTSAPTDSFGLYDNDYTAEKRTSPMQGEVGVGTEHTRSNGPYPVFMTIQELTEFIDDYRHIGQLNASKPSFLPHGVEGRDSHVSATSANPVHGADPRIEWMVDTNSESAFGHADIPATSPYRATVFHPMLLDVNQFHKDISGATIKVSSGIRNGSTSAQYFPNGITRYDSDPSGLDSSTIKYKVFGKSGDHLTGLLHANLHANLPNSNYFQSFDSTAVPSPKYRMKMALACFLKDGTYSLNDGVIVPYVYDQTRHIGGTVTSTLYSIWDGLHGYGSEDDATYYSNDYLETNDCSAQIFPFFDFTQGPLAPSAQGNNWTNEQMTARHTTTTNANGVLNTIIAPPPHRMAILGMKKTGSLITVFCDHMDTTEDTALPAGTPIYLENNNANNFGTTNKATFPTAERKLWPDRWGLRGNQDGSDTYEDSDDSTDVGRSYNGWWITNADATITTGNSDADWQAADAPAGMYDKSGQTIANGYGGTTRSFVAFTFKTALFETGTDLNEVILFNRGDAYLRRGMVGGSEQKYFHTPDADDNATAGNIFGIEKRDANAEGSPSHSELGTGFQIGVSQMDSNVPARSSVDATYPGRPTIGERSLPSVDGKHRDGKVVLRSIGIVTKDVDGKILSAPNTYNEGDGALRIPSPLGYDLSDRYITVSGNYNDRLRADSGFPRLNGEYGHDKWLFRGVSTPFWSYTDTNTGRRAWDYIKPVGTALTTSGTWTYGRNRPWPGHERLGTRLSMSPTLLRSTDHSATWTESVSGDVVSARSSTTKYGLSEMAASPVYLDAEITAFFPARPNRMIMVEFDGNEEHPVFGRHSMVMDTPAHNYGMGLEPIWDGNIDGISQLTDPTSVSGTALTIPTNSDKRFYTRLTAAQHNGENAGPFRSGYFDSDDVAVTAGTVKTVPGLHNMKRLFWNHTPNATGNKSADVGVFDVKNRYARVKADNAYPPSSIYNRPAVWMTGGLPHLTTSGTWTGFVDLDGDDTYNLPGTGGFGRLGNGFGTSNYFTFSEGTNTLRTVFNTKGMTFLWNGEVVGTDVSCRTPVWAMSIKSCDIATFPVRTPIAHPSNSTDHWANHWAEGDPAVMHTGTRDYNRDDRVAFTEHQGARYTLYLGEMTYATSGTSLSRSVSTPYAFDTDSTLNAAMIARLTDLTATEAQFVVFTSDNFAGTPFTIGKQVITESSGTLSINVGSATYIFTIGGSPPTWVNNATYHVFVSLQGEPITPDSIPITSLNGFTQTSYFEPEYPARTLLHVPADPTDFLDSNGEITRLTNPTLQKSNQDLQIDSMTLRQLPTDSMLPFTVDSIKQQPSTTVARYTKLNIYARNIDKAKGMDVRVTLLEPPVVATIDQEASTTIDGFIDRELDYTGGIGTLDLTGLPSSVVANGFVVRFNFYIPSVSDTLLHPIDWSAIPYVTSWDVEYDEKPTVDIAVISNSYDGSTATSVVEASDTTFATKVGHVITFRVSGATTDENRTISEFKVEYGDGTDSGWVKVETPATSITQDISYVYTTTTGTRNVKAYVKDDVGNESVASDPTITYTIVNAEPIAILRAIPTMVRAGQAIRLDASSSYSINSSASLSTYTFNFGDGSSAVSSGTSYNDHTYAEAGEFLATLVVVDSNGTSSATAKVVVKVLPATLIIPLTLNTKPSSFSRRRVANFTQTPVLDAVYPEVTDRGQRVDEFEMQGIFLKETENTDIEFMEELLQSGALVEFEYEAVNFSGQATNKTFVGRMVSFNYQRQGGNVGQTPYTAVFVREAGLGA